MNSIFDSRVVAKVKVSDWLEALNLTGKLLMKDGLAKPEYVKAMAEQIKKNGPYIVIAPGVALAHSRPEDGALGNGMALVTLKNPVCFGHKENDPVDVIIGFTAKNPEDHLLSIQKIGKLLMLQDFLDEVREASNDTELSSIVEKYINTLGGCDE